MPPTLERQILDALNRANEVQESLLKEVGDKYDLLQARINERFAQMDEKLERLNVILTGNGDPSKGLVVRVDRLEHDNIEDGEVRVDRLEQSESRRNWLVGTTLTAVIGVVVAEVVGFFTRH